jgi:protein ImuA
MTSLARISAGSPDPQDIHADVWHAHALAGSPQVVQPTGDALLDAQLPGGGWPVGALVELLQPAGVHCEWRLLLPALARCGQGPVVLVGAPYLPFVPALAALGLRASRLLAVGATGAAQDGRLWATEQLLRCAEVDAVLAWLPQARSDQLRRLQMAAAEHHKLLFVMRPAALQADASPAALRLVLQPQPPAQSPRLDALEVQIVKRRGPPLAQPLQLQARAARLAVLLAAEGTHALDRTAAHA